MSLCANRTDQLAHLEYPVSCWREKEHAIVFLVAFVLILFGVLLVDLYKIYVITPRKEKTEKDRQERARLTMQTNDERHASRQERKHNFSSSAMSCDDDLL